jgi:AraC-like DNA-binding protein
VRDIIADQPTVAIKELSYKVGYKSPRSFARAIRQASGLTPKEVRMHYALNISKEVDNKGQRDGFRDIIL